MEDQTMNNYSWFKSLGICCLGRFSGGNKDCYIKAATELGHELGKRKINLLHGGDNTELMGLVSQGVHDAGGSVLRLVTRAIISAEIPGEAVGEVRTVADMDQVIAEMARLSDCFIALPGGTLEELGTWAELCNNQKPMGLLNVDGYYDLLISQLKDPIAVAATNAKELVEKLEAYVPVNDGPGGLGGGSGLGGVGGMGGIGGGCSDTTASTKP